MEMTSTTSETKRSSIRDGEGKKTGQTVGMIAGLATGLRLGENMLWELPGNYSAVKDAVCVFGGGLFGGVAGYYVGERVGKVLDDKFP